MKRSLLVLIVALALGLFALLGCSTRSGYLGEPTRPAREAGAKVWADQCGRCHAVRPPDAYNDRQWRITVKHMRHQANLTGAEERAIREFLMSAN